MLVQYLGWCLPFECLAGSVVEGVSDCVELVLVVAGKVGPFGKYWRSSPFDLYTHHQLELDPRIYGLFADDLLTEDTANDSDDESDGSAMPVDLGSRWVELRGFEPLTPSLRTRCATGLRHSPSTAPHDNTPSPTESRRYTALAKDHARRTPKVAGPTQSPTAR
jgi:hypothetical protein